MGEPVQRQLPKSQDIVFYPLWGRPCIHSASTGPSWPGPCPSHVPSERKGAAYLKGAFPLGMWEPESFPRRVFCLQPFSGHEHLLGASQAPSAHYLALWEL